MIIYLAHGETPEQQQLLIKAKATGVLLSHKILSQKSDEYIHTLLARYEHYAAIMIDPEDTQGEEYINWAYKYSRYHNITFLEPSFSAHTNVQVRKQAQQSNLSLIPVWNPNHQDLKEFEGLCQEYAYIALKEVKKKQDFMKLLHIAYPYGTKLHAHSLTTRHALVKPTILKNLPLASITCTNWLDATKAGYIFVFSPSKRELRYEPYTQPKDTRAMNKLSASAWASYSTYLDTTQWKYWPGEEQKRFEGNRHTAAVEKYIVGRNTPKLAKPKIPPTDDPELIKDLAESSREVGASFEDNQGKIHHILKNNSLIENKRRRGHEAWLWDKRAEAVAFQEYMKWAQRSGFNKLWLDIIEENKIASPSAIATVGRELLQRDFEEYENTSYGQIIAQYIQGQKPFPLKPWLRKSTKRPVYQK